MKPYSKSREKLGKILSDARLLSSEMLSWALKEQQRTGKRLGDILVEKGAVTEKEIANAYSVHFGLPYRTFDYINIPSHALKIITKEFAERNGIIPVKVDKKSITFAVSDPFCEEIINSIDFTKGKTVEINISTPTEIRKAIQGVYQGGKADRLGDILIEAGLITEEKLELVATRNKKSKKRLGELLVENDYVSESDLVQALSIQLGVPYTDLAVAQVEQSAIDAIPENLAIKHLILPLNIFKNTITIVMANPLDNNAISSINAALETGMDLKVTVSTYTEIKEAINKHYSHHFESESEKDTTTRDTPARDITAAASLVSSKEYKRDLKSAKKMLGTILVNKGLLTKDNLQECLEIQKETKKKLGRILVELGYVKETDIVEALSEQLHIPCVDLTTVEPDPKTFQSIPLGFAERFLLVPISMDKTTITIVMANPFDKKTIDEISYITGRSVKVAIAGHVDIRKAIQMYYRKLKPLKLGEILIEAGFIKTRQLNESLKIQKTTNEKLGDILIKSGFVKEDGIALAFSKQLGIPYSELSSLTPDLGAAKLIDQSLAEDNVLIPISMDKRTITIAMADPLHLDAIKEVRMVTGKNVKITVAPKSAISNMIAECYQFSDSFVKMGGSVTVVDNKEDVFQTTEEATKKTESKPIISIVNNMITEAVQLHASDIHVEMGATSLIVRCRVDGLLRDMNYLPKWVQWPVVSRIKIMAKMDITERRVPQDGRIRVKVGEKELDLRVSTIPSQYGEKVVIRLLDPHSAILNIEEMGLSYFDHERLTDMIDRPQGIVIVTGPTGSGKTSTLYAMLNHIKDKTKNIVTLEDPIEYELEGINQIAINPRLTFASALRAVLRQDPDIILIGEMRDSETANIAIQASITGHLVLTTLHTTTSVAAINRLKNLGVKPFMIATALNGIVSQRLVRKVCPECKEPYEPTKDNLSRLGLSDQPSIKKLEAYKGKGCLSCNKTGFKGRSGVFEILTVDSKLRNLIINDAPEDKIVKSARKAGMKYMIEDGVEKIEKGDISIIDLPRVISAEEGMKEIPMLLCQRCGEGVRDDYDICPFCGLPHENRCPQCKKSTQPKWKFCPYCSMQFHKTRQKKQETISS